MRSLQRSRALLPTKANPPRKARGKMKRNTMVRIGRQEEGPRYNEDTEELMRVSIYIYFYLLCIFSPFLQSLPIFLSVTQRSDAGALRLKSSSHSTRVLLCLVPLGIAPTSALSGLCLQRPNALPQGTDKNKKEKSSTHLAECSTQGGYYQQRTRLLG